MSGDECAFPGIFVFKAEKDFGNFYAFYKKAIEKSYALSYNLHNGDMSVL